MYSNMYTMLFFRNAKRFSSGRESFLALPGEENAGSTAVHDDASVGPGQLPWHVLWAFNVRNLASNCGVAFRGARAELESAKPIHQLFCSTEPPQTNTRFTLSPFFQRRTILFPCGPLQCVCRHFLHWHVCCVATCACVCGSLHSYAATAHFSLFFYLIAAAASTVRS